MLLNQHLLCNIHHVSSTISSDHLVIILIRNHSNRTTLIFWAQFGPFLQAAWPSCSVRKKFLEKKCCYCPLHQHINALVLKTCHIWQSPGKPLKIPVSWLHCIPIKSKSPGVRSRHHYFFFFLCSSGNSVYGKLWEPRC